MVRAFCEYWGINERDVRSVGRKFDETMQELMVDLQNAETAEQRAAVQEKISELATEFSYMYHMVYMTAASYGVVNQKPVVRKRTRNNVPVVV